MKRRPVAGVILLAGFLAGCRTGQIPSVRDPSGPPPAPSPAPPARVTGTITYRERIALPPDAMIRVTLADLSRRDTPPIVLGEQIILPGTQVPVSFEVEYDPARITPAGSYGIQARITSGGELLFVTRSSIPVLTGSGTGPIEVIVEPAQ